MKTLLFIKVFWLAIVSLAVVLFIISSCRPQEDEIVAPTVKTVSISDITETNATITGMIISDGGSKVTEQGIYLDDTKKIPISSIDNNSMFSTSVSDLIPGTIYSVKAYAKNIAGVNYGETLEFVTSSSLPVLEIKEATEVTINSATLNGIVKQDNIPEDISFTFEYGLSGNFDESIPAELLVNNPEGIMAMANISGLESGETYVYRLKAEDSQSKTSYSQIAEFTTTSQTLFSIPNVEIKDVETDEDGNVYVMGVTRDNPSNYDGVVAKFNADGQMLWQSMIATENHDRPQGGLIAKDGVLYVHANRYDEYGIGGGKLYVDAYNCESGNLLWSTEVSEGLGCDLALSEDDYIYSVAYIQITKLDLSGEIVSQFTAQGPYGFDAISFYENKIFVGGARTVPEGSESMIWCFDNELNLLWDTPGSVSKGIASFSSIVSFPNKNLIFLGESKGVIVDGTPMEASVVCYELKENSLEFKWKKLFDESFHIRLQREGDNFYVYSSDYGIGGISDNPKGPILMTTEGNVVWTANPKINGYIATFGDKMYVADGNSFLTVILI
jgi:hypothetical protein